LPTELGRERLLATELTGFGTRKSRFRRSQKVRATETLVMSHIQSVSTESGVVVMFTLLYTQFFSF